MNKSLFATLLALCVSACQTSVVMTGKQYPAVDPLDVKILFSDKPKCHYEELAFISTPQEFNQQVAIESARKKAASIGADYMVITGISKNGFNDASVNALAYKCDDVDREKVEVNPKK